MKAISIAFTSIKAQESALVLAGGMESMSQVPFALPSQLRCSNAGLRFGHPQNIDLLIKDGLTDASPSQTDAEEKTKNSVIAGKSKLMGECAEVSAKELQITREDMDSFAKGSFEKAMVHLALFSEREIVAVPIKMPNTPPVPVITSKGLTALEDDEQLSKMASKDEGVKNFKPEKMSVLRPAFGGAITAATSSQLTDGACCHILCSGAKAMALGLEASHVLCKIVACADASMDPIDFTIAPSQAIEKVLRKSKWSLEDVDLFEINEAFAVTPLANACLLKIPLEKVNVCGGAIALGHPLGCSGARIVGTLITALRLKGLKKGCAAICNGGGGATAVTIELL